MECFIVNGSDIATDLSSLVLRDDEAKHCARALRIRVGEQILATDLSGNCYKATLEAIDDLGKHGYEVRASIDQVLPRHNEPTLNVLLIQAVLHTSAKFEEIIERCCEIGVSGFTPISTTRVERPAIKADRIEKILRASCKQAQRAMKPIFAELSEFETALNAAVTDNRFIVLLHEAAPLEHSLNAVLTTRPSSHIALVVGPEGGFTEEEVSLARETYGAHIASMGTRRLRAETAAITAAAITLGFDR